MFRIQKLEKNVQDVEKDDLDDFFFCGDSGFLGNGFQDHSNMGNSPAFRGYIDMSTIRSACHEENFLFPQPCNVLFWEALKDFAHGDDAKPLKFSSNEQFPPLRRSNFSQCEHV